MELDCDTEMTDNRKVKIHPLKDKPSAILNTPDIQIASVPKSKKSSKKVIKQKAPVDELQQFSTVISDDFNKAFDESVKPDPPKITPDNQYHVYIDKDSKTDHTVYDTINLDAFYNNTAYNETISNNVNTFLPPSESVPYTYNFSLV